MRFTPTEHPLITELMHFEDAHERLSAVVDRTRQFPRFSTEEKSDQHRVPGCSSSVWLLSELRAGRCFFRADADSPVVRGLVSLVAEFYSGGSPAEICATDADPLSALDLARSLSSTRLHGLAAVRGAIRRFAEENLSAPNSPA